MKQVIYFIFLSYTSTHAGLLVDSFHHAVDNNHYMKVASAHLDYEKASSHYENERSNVKFVADGFARYYTPQNSGLSHANFNLPTTTVTENFTKANVNIVLSKDIYSPKTIALQALGKEKVKKASYALNENKNRLILDILHEYIMLLKSYDALALTQKRYFLSSKELEEGVAKEEVGKLDRVELQLLHSKHLEFEVRTKVYFDRFQNILNNFESLTQHSLTTLAFLKQNINYRQKERKSLTFYQEQLPESNLKLLELDKEIEISKKNIALIQAKYNPSLTAQVGYEYTQNYTPVIIGRTYESGAFIGLSTFIPIYTGGRERAETQKAMLGVQEEQEKKDEEESRLLLSLQKEYRLYNSITLEIEVTRQHLKTLALLKKQASIKTKEGLMFPIEKARIEYQYEEVESYLKHLEYNYFLADTNIKYLAGTLSVDDLFAFESQLEEHTLLIENVKG